MILKVKLKPEYFVLKHYDEFWSKNKASKLAEGSIIVSWVHRIIYYREPVMCHSLQINKIISNHLTVIVDPDLLLSSENPDLLPTLENPDLLPTLENPDLLPTLENSVLLPNLENSVLLPNLENPDLS